MPPFGEPHFHQVEPVVVRAGTHVVKAGVCHVVLPSGKLRVCSNEEHDDGA